VLRVLTLDLMGPGAFLLLDLLFESVIDVNNTVCAKCGSQRAGNLVAIESDGPGCHSLFGRIPRLEVVDRAGSEVMEGARVLVGLYVYDMRKGSETCGMPRAPTCLDIGLRCGSESLIPPGRVVNGRRSLIRLAGQVPPLLALQDLARRSIT
jgi:hypothetical protein